MSIPKVQVINILDRPSCYPTYMQLHQYQQFSTSMDLIEVTVFNYGSHWSTLPTLPIKEPIYQVADSSHSILSPIQEVGESLYRLCQKKNNSYLVLHSLPTIKQLEDTLTLLEDINYSQFIISWLELSLPHWHFHQTWSAKEVLRFWAHIPISLRQENLHSLQNLKQQQLCHFNIRHQADSTSCLGFIKVIISLKLLG